MIRFLLAAALTLPVQDPKPEAVAIDAPVKDFRLKDVLKDGDVFVSLSDFKDNKAVVLIFTSYNCDACTDYENRTRKLVADFAGQDVAFLGVRSSAEDDAAGMRKYALAQGYKFPVLDDPRNVLADYFDMKVTPTFYVIDKKGVLRYRGAYDESLKESKAQKTYVHDALRAVLEGKEVALKTTRTIGCHMPRVEPGK